MDKTESLKQEVKCLEQSIGMCQAAILVQANWPEKMKLKSQLDQWEAELRDKKAMLWSQPSGPEDMEVY